MQILETQTGMECCLFLRASSDAESGNLAGVSERLRRLPDLCCVRGRGEGATEVQPCLRTGQLAQAICLEDARELHPPRSSSTCVAKKAGSGTTWCGCISHGGCIGHGSSSDHENGQPTHRYSGGCWSSGSLADGRLFQQLRSLGRGHGGRRASFFAYTLAL